MPPLLLCASGHISPNTLANGRPISLPAGWGGGNSPSGTGSRRAGCGGKALEDPATKSDSCLSAYDPRVNRSNRCIAISVNWLNRCADGILEPSTLPSHTENQWLALPGCEGFGPHTGGTYLAVRLSARTRLAGWLLDANTPGRRSLQAV